MYLQRQNSAFSVLVLVLLFSPLVPSHKYKKKKTDHRGISAYEVPNYQHYAPPLPAYPTTYYPTAYAPSQYSAPAYGPAYYPPHPQPYGITYETVCTENCDGDEGKKSNKWYIKDLKKEEIKLYKGLKKLTKGLWKGYKKGDEEKELVTVHRPIYHPPPPPRLVEVRVPKCRDTVEVPTYITETLIKTHKVYVTKTRTKTTERHIKEYIVNTEFRTKTATKVVSHYAPQDTVTVYSQPDTVVKTNYVTQYHPTTQYVPHYVTVTVSPEPSYEPQQVYYEQETPYQDHATPYQASEVILPSSYDAHIPPSSYGEHVTYAKRNVDDQAKQSPQLQASQRTSDAGATV